MVLQRTTRKASNDINDKGPYMLIIVAKLLRKIGKHLKLKNVTAHVQAHISQHNRPQIIQLSIVLTQEKFQRPLPWLKGRITIFFNQEESAKCTKRVGPGENVDGKVGCICEIYEKWLSKINGRGYRLKDTTAWWLTVYRLKDTTAWWLTVHILRKMLECTGRGV